jgi:hypothetical protein
MVRNFQHLSRSQFVLTYGPGSIIETRKGPRLIPRLNRGLDRFFNEDTFEKFAIPDFRLCKYIQNKSQEHKKTRIFALPSNAGLGKPDNYRIYKTQLFPAWKICYGRKEGDTHKPILYIGYKCPLCQTDEHSGSVRFVAACSAGHLDEVNWNYAVHKDNKNCIPRYYNWKVGGSSLSDIVVECPDCKEKKTMKEIYKTNFRCTGRHPENERPKNDFIPYISEVHRPNNCGLGMKVTQRQSTSLRMPDTTTLLTIPKYDNPLGRVLQLNNVSIVLDTTLSTLESVLSQLDQEKIKDIIQKNLSGKVSDEAAGTIISSIESMGIDGFLSFYGQINSETSSFMDLIYEEFESLLSGAGVHKDNFVMDNYEEFSLESVPIVPPLRVFPVKKIRTITVQTGYRRMQTGAGDDESGSVSSGVPLGDYFWYPGFEGFGEGLFITPANGKIPDLSASDAYNNWIEFSLSGYEGNSEWTDICASPEFVWLHTLSHALIRALSGFTGYSSASLRERVYLSRDGKNGGILIYNTSPGEDGGKGGLTGTIRYFERIVKEAEEIINVCSNDPLCRDITKSSESINGAACYSCLLLSETSCEHRNLWLDRHILME